MASVKRPTILDVARVAGVSPATVSYVIGGTAGRASRISEPTREHVLAVIDELGYVPNQVARSLRTRRSNRVLFLGGRFNSLYSQAIAMSIEPSLRASGLTLDVEVGADPDRVQHAIALLDQHQADGLIIETDDEAVPKLRDAALRGHAIVAIGPSRPEPRFDVMSNNVGPAIAEAMNHLLSRGFASYLLLTQRPSPPWEHRIQVAQETLLAAGVPPASIHIVTCPHDRIHAHGVAIERLPGLPRPLAVYAGSDVSAIGVLWAATRLGLAVPGDVAIVGHGNTAETHITVPRLTSLGPVSSDFSQAASMMTSRLEHPDLPGRFISEPCSVSIRDST